MFTRRRGLPVLLLAFLLAGCRTPAPKPASASTPSGARTFTPTNRNWEREPPYGTRGNNADGN